MKIAFVALWSPQNVTYWSGTPHHSYHALKSVYPDLILVDTPYLDRILFYLGKVSRRLRIDILREPVVLSLYQRCVSRILRQHKPDVVVSVGASHKLQAIPKTFHIIHAADALFATIVAYYPGMAHLSKRSLIRGDVVQRRFLDHVDVLCLTSDWALRSAKENYALDGCRLREVPLGANIEITSGLAPTRRTTSGPLSLLFIGGDWVRKGGPLVLETFAKLQGRFDDAELHIVGCRPDISGVLNGIVLHGFLDKSEPDDAERLAHLFRTASFLFVPSRQEAFGLIFCEACAYGLPSVATSTGGIPSILTDRHDAILLPLDAKSEEFADRIETSWTDRKAYERLCTAARVTFEERLSWPAWAAAIKDEIKRLGPWTC